MPTPFPVRAFNGVEIKLTDQAVDQAHRAEAIGLPPDLDHRLALRGLPPMDVLVGQAIEAFSNDPHYLASIGRAAMGSTNLGLPPRQS